MYSLAGETIQEFDVILCVGLFYCRLHIKLMQTDSTDWSRLSAEIDLYKRKAKLNLEQYEKKRFFNLYRKKRQTTQMEDQISPQKLGCSMNMLREQYDHEKQHSRAIQNRLSFLKTQRDRKIQTSERARRKAERVMGIRSISVNEKNFYSSEIETCKAEVIERNRNISAKARSERAKIEAKRSKILSQNCLKAKEVKQEKLLNEETISKEKEISMARKQNAVKSVQQQIENALRKKQMRRDLQITVGKIHHEIKIKQQYAKLQFVRKNNAYMLSRFKKESERIVEEYKNADENLRRFEKFLYLQKNISKRPETAKAIERVGVKIQKAYQDMAQTRVACKEEPSGSFYLTN